MMVDILPQTKINYTAPPKQMHEVLTCSDYIMLWSCVWQFTHADFAYQCQWTNPEEYG